MVKKEDKIKELKIERPKRVRLSAKESLKRMQEFSKRKQKLVAALAALYEAAMLVVALKVYHAE